MRKFTFLLLAVIIASYGSLTAQQFHIEKSAAFDEPEYGWNKLLQLKNGNTFFFHSTKKEGIEVVVYNKARKLISTKTLESNLWDVGKMKATRILGLYEINGNPTLFVVQADGREPTLYRMNINPNTGARMGEAKVGNLPKIGAFAGYALAFGNVDAPDIIVEKDQKSDCYAVIYFDGLSHESNERIKVVHYDGTHKILNTAYYDSPEGKYKYLRYIGAAVDGDKRVYVAAYGYNGKADEDTRPSVIISRLNANEKKFTHKLIKVSNDFNDTKSVMVYNHGTNKLQLMTVSYAKSRYPVWENTNFDYYKKKNLSSITLLNYIDPETLDLIKTVPVTGEKIDAYGKSNIDKDYEYDGVPLTMILNKDNTTTVLLEDITNITERTGTHDVMGHQNMTGHTTHKTQLGPAGISEFSSTGDEVAGYAISKKQMAQGTLPVLYMASRSKGLFYYPTEHKSNNNEFLSYDYIYTDKGRYVVFNDLPGNADKDEDDEKRKTVARVSKTNTMCYKLGDVKMDKFYLFGEPKEDSKSTFCYIESSDYNKDLNTYATMIVERDGRDKQAKIAWVTFE